MATVTYVREQGAPYTVNTYQFFNQLAPDALTLANGGYAVAYNNQDENNGYILVDFFDANGAPMGYTAPYTIELGENTLTTTDAVGTPRMAQLANGNIVVVWADAHATALGIRQAILSDTGAIVSAESAVVVDPSMTAPEVTALTGGGYVVAYTSVSGSYMTVYDNTGTPGSQALINTTTDGNQSSPVVTALADGGFVAIFQDDSIGGSDINLRARVFEANGAPRSVNGSTDDFIIAEFGANTQPAISTLKNGNIAVVYADDGWDAGGITLTILNPATGAITLDYILVNDDTESVAELDPDIAVLENGFFVVTWSTPFSVGDNDIYFAVFDQNGGRVTVEGNTINSITTSATDDTRSSVSAFLEGRFVTVWQDAAVDAELGSIQGNITDVARLTESDGTGETLDGDALRDIMNGNGGLDILDGKGGNDILTGGEGNDRLIGGTGADYMTGGIGNDAYYVDQAGDAVVETANQGTDTVRSSAAAYQLTNYVENLILTGSSNINGTGNGTQNTITGNAGNNVLDGKASGDTLIGGAGDDTYVIDHVNDVITENVSEGTDTVKAYNNYVLAANVEHLTMVGGALNGAGNNLNNTIKGNDNNNVITGGDGNDYLGGFLGNDRLTGGAGQDIFLFNTAPNTSTNRDQITDFNSADDTIRLDDAVFSALSVGVLGAAAYSAGSSAAGAGDRIIYDSGNGSLYYDPDGVGGAAQVRFAILQTGLTLSNTDFVII